MKRSLITLHRWLGFPLGLVFMITFGSGCLTALGELLDRKGDSQRRAAFTYRMTTIPEQAAALGVVTRDKPGIRKIIMPTARTPYYEVVTREETWTYPLDYFRQEIHQINKNEGFFTTVLKLHRTLLLGDDGLWGIDGKYYVAWVGLFALLLSLIGLWLWWPRRASFHVRDILPRGKKRKYFYFSHLTSGIICLVAICVLALTGAAISYRGVTQQLFGVAPDSSSNMAPIAVGRGWQAWLRAAHEAMPAGAELTAIYYPRQVSGVQGGARENTPSKDAPQQFELRFSTPGDWFGIAKSSVKIDKHEESLVEVRLFERLPFNEKIYSILGPLHTGHNLSVVYVVLQLLFSALGTVMVISGLVSFVTKKRKYLKARRVILAS